MKQCPSEEQLASFVLGDGTEDLEAIRAHVGRCSSCQAWMEDIQANDAIMNDVKRALDDSSAEALSRTRLDPALSRIGDTVPVRRGSSARGSSWNLDAGVGAPPDRRIEGYAIREELGRGGMGVVYRAVQLSTKREVALKILLEGRFASRTARRRFEREVELAAQLQHPSIATVLESGITRGRYYFAMQYVAGPRLDHYLADRALAIRNKLGLFVEICNAVNYAHQRGVIHRDLKPSNILIDDEGRPHVLDFGLAKPTAHQQIGEEETQLSMTGQIMGTLPYMSPEQATGTQQDVDVRTDVYALGVNLYEMLTGRFPYPVVGQLAEILRNICETPPARPSQFQRRIDNELETIVLTALAKEKERRYQTVDALAQDVQRYLQGEPIEAKRDSTTYVLRKMLKRHRVSVSIATAFVLLAAFGLAGVTIHRTRLHRAQANLVMAEMVDDPTAGLERMQTAPGGVRDRVVEMAGTFVNSQAYTQRVMGARTAFVADEHAFWAAVDGGALWEHGEWLELAFMPWDQQADGVVSLMEYARYGSPRQQYVALCLLGTVPSLSAEQKDLLTMILRDTEDPGAAMAAWWAARRHDVTAVLTDTETVRTDPLTGLVFVRVPSSDAFRRGAGEDDPDQLPDETRSSEAVAIDALFISTTEVTLAALQPFLEDPASLAVLSPRAREGLALQQAAAGPDRLESTAAGFLSHHAARAFCAWLNGQHVSSSPGWRYRLPTEDEWEYACRANHDTRFCYGDNVRYLHLFASCDGEIKETHRVAEHMPNAFGLFDMHGGLWERVDSRYPDTFVDEAEHRGKALWVLRGGAYYSPARRCRSSQRNYSEADAVDQYVGIRLVMEPKP